MRKKGSKSGHIHGPRNSPTTALPRPTTPKRASGNERAIGTGIQGGTAPGSFLRLSPEKAGRETTPQVWTCAGPNGTAYRFHPFQKEVERCPSPIVSPPLGGPGRLPGGFCCPAVGHPGHQRPGLRRPGPAQHRPDGDRPRRPGAASGPERHRPGQDQVTWQAQVDQDTDPAVRQRLAAPLPGGGGGLVRHRACGGNHPPACWPG